MRRALRWIAVLDWRGVGRTLLVLLGFVAIGLSYGVALGACQKREMAEPIAVLAPGESLRMCFSCDSETGVCGPVECEQAAGGETAEGAAL